MSSKPEPRVAAPAGLWGLELAKAASDDAEGVDVKAVLTGGAAAEGGLKAGDRVLTIDGRWTDTIGRRLYRGQLRQAGQAGRVVVKRDGKEVKLTVSPKTGL